MIVAPTIDVSDLPLTAFDTRTPHWWGNTLFMLIESMTIILIVISYFYNWQYDPQWPPTQSNQGTATPSPYPGLGLSTLDTALVLVSCLPVFRLDRAARRMDARAIKLGLGLMVGVGSGLIVLRFAELRGLGFRWDDHAYGSLVWAMLVMHLTYLIAAILEVGVTLLWVVLYGVDEERAVDVTLTTIYWFWMTGVWVLLYATVYWAPRLL